MDEHEKYIHEICNMYNNQHIDDRICLSAAVHASLTNQAANATRELISRLSVEARIEIISYLILAREMRQANGEPSKNIEICLNTFQSFDQDLGIFLRKRLSPDEYLNRMKLVVEDMELMRNLRDPNGKPYSHAENRQHENEVKEKNVFSYRTLLEVVIRQKVIEMQHDKKAISFIDQIKRYIQSYLYASHVSKILPR